MTHAYAAIYLPDAEDCLACAVDYAVHDGRVSADDFAGAFVRSGLARQFERGNPSVVAGRSGIELAVGALTGCGLMDDPPKPTYTRDRSREYWAGWAVAQYQWARACRFEDLFARLPLSEVVGMYQPLHEADIEVIVERMDGRIAGSVAGRVFASPRERTSLARIRRLRGLTQAELAREAGVTVKSVQAWEQRVNDLGRAGAQTVERMAWVLGCNPGDLLEPFGRSYVEYDSSKA